MTPGMNQQIPMTLTIISTDSLKTPTIAERLQDGEVAVHQGRNYVTLSGDELTRLVAVATPASSMARTSMRSAAACCHPM